MSKQNSHPDTWWWKLLTWLVEHVAAFLLVLWSRTWRYEYINYKYFKAARLSSKGAFVGSWHGSLFTAALTHAHQGIYALVSPVWEGEIIGRLLQGAGFKLLRGSGRSDRVSGFKEGVRVLREGELLTIAMDGPSGPSKIVKPGIITMTAFAGAWFIPVHAAGRKSIFLPTWDHHEIPLPFTKVVVGFGKPMQFPSRMSKEEIADACENTRATMNKLELDIVNRLI